MRHGVNFLLFFVLNINFTTAFGSDLPVYSSPFLAFGKANYDKNLSLVLNAVYKAKETFTPRLSDEGCKEISLSELKFSSASVNPLSKSVTYFYGTTKILTSFPERGCVFSLQFVVDLNDVNNPVIADFPKAHLYDYLEID